MGEQQTACQRYKVSVHELPDEPGALVFTFVPRGLQQVRANGEALARPSQYILTLRAGAVSWNATSDDPGAARAELEQEAIERANARQEWVARVTQLVGDVEHWSGEQGWATRRIDKRIDDSWIGRHTVPALLLQEGTCRLLLEPVGRSAPGVEGVVDLYQLPAYDDTATLYFYGGAWHVHYPAGAAAGPGKELSRATMQRVLDTLRSHAA